MRVVVVHVAPRVEAAAVVAVLTVIVVVPVVVIVMDGTATEFPFCLMPCDVIFVAAVVAAACAFFCAQARASKRERVRSGTQLDGTVVAVVAWCCVLPLWLLLLLFL